MSAKRKPKGVVPTDKVKAALDIMLASPPMSFDDAVRTLGIEEFRERIWNSNSRGELSHIADYCYVAGVLKDNMTPERRIEFREWFRSVVKVAEETWQRPESVFQHLQEILRAGVAKSEAAA